MLHQNISLHHYLAKLFLMFNFSLEVIEILMITHDIESLIEHSYEFLTYKLKF